MGDERKEDNMGWLEGRKMDEGVRWRGGGQRWEVGDEKVRGGERWGGERLVWWRNMEWNEVDDFT